MSNSKYAVMLGCEPYDYVERSAEGLLRCMRSIRRDGKVAFSSDWEV